MSEEPLKELLYLEKRIVWYLWGKEPPQNEPEWRTFVSICPYCGARDQEVHGFRYSILTNLPCCNNQIDVRKDKIIYGMGELINNIRFKIDRGRIIVNGIYSKASVVSDKEALTSHVFFGLSKAITFVFDLNKRTTFVLTRTFNKKRTATIKQISCFGGLRSLEGYAFYNEMVRVIEREGVCFPTKEENDIFTTFISSKILLEKYSPGQGPDVFSFNKFREFDSSEARINVERKVYLYLLKINRDPYRHLNQLSKKQKKAVINSKERIIMLGTIMTLKTIFKNDDFINKIIRFVAPGKQGERFLDMLYTFKKAIKYLTKNKGERAVANMFCDDDSLTWCIRDTFNMLNDFLEMNVHPILQGPMKSLHDNLSKQYQKLQIEDKEIKYKEEEIYLNFFDEDTGCDFALVKTTHELVDIGTEMVICVGSYWKDVLSKQSTILKVVHHGAYVACIELTPNQSLVQAKGVRNQLPEKEICGAIMRWVEQKQVKKAFDCWDFQRIVKKYKDDLEDTPVYLQRREVLANLRAEIGVN